MCVCVCVCITNEKDNIQKNNRLIKLDETKCSDYLKLCGKNKNKNKNILSFFILFRKNQFPVF